MNEQVLNATAKAMVTDGRGLLAADESTGTIEKRFKSISVENTEPNRRAYRDMLFTTPGFEQHTSGVILFEETLFQSGLDGTPFAKLLGADPGAVHIGAYTSPNFFPTVRFNPFGNSTVVSPLLLHSYVQTNGDRATWRNSIAGDTGWSNQVSYTTPDFDGFTLDLHYQFGEVAGHSGKRNVGARGSYTRGSYPGPGSSTIEWCTRMLAASPEAATLPTPSVKRPAPPPPVPLPPPDPDAPQGPPSPSSSPASLPPPSLPSPRCRPTRRRRPPSSSATGPGRVPRSCARARTRSWPSSAAGRLSARWRR